MMAIRMPSHLTEYCHTLVKQERHKPKSHLAATAFVYNVRVNDLYSHNKILRATNHKPGSTRILTGFPCSVSILTLAKIHQKHCRYNVLHYIKSTTEALYNCNMHTDGLQERISNLNYSLYKI